MPAANPAYSEVLRANLRASFRGRQTGGRRTDAAGYGQPAIRQPQLVVGRDEPLANVYGVEAVQAYLDQMPQRARQVLAAVIRSEAGKLYRRVQRGMTRTVGLRKDYTERRTSLKRRSDRISQVVWLGKDDVQVGALMKTADAAAQVGTGQIRVRGKVYPGFMIISKRGFPVGLRREGNKLVPVRVPILNESNKVAVQSFAGTQESVVQEFIRRMEDPDTHIQPIRKPSDFISDVRGKLYGGAKALGDLGALGLPAGSGLRTQAYTAAQRLGDVQAIRSGEVGQRISARYQGKIASRGISGGSRGTRRVSGKVSGRLLSKAPLRRR